MDDLLSEFLTESAESLESLDAELVKLERNPNDPELLSSIFRLMHTIKGTCGFLGLSRLESVAHAGENVLGNFRDGVQDVTPEAVSLVLKAIDRIKSLLADLEQNEAEPEGDDNDLIAQLNAMYRAGRDGKAAVPPAPAKKAAPPAATAKPTTVQPKSAATATDVYERIGGAATLDAAVEIALGKLRTNTDFAPFFADIDPNVLQGRVVEYLVESVGGPSEYGGPPPTTVKNHLAAQSFVQAHVETALAELGAALSTLDVTTADAGLVTDRLREKLRMAFGDFAAGVPAKAAAAKTKAEPAPKASAAKSASQPIEEQTLFARIGGEAAVDAAVGLMYRNILADPELVGFFEGVDLDLLHKRQVEFVVKALGGPDNYSGGDVAAVHRRLVENGLNDHHFDKVVAHLTAALTELEVPKELIDAVIGVVATTRDAVLDKGAQASQRRGAPTKAAPAPEPKTSDHGGELGQAKESAVANQSIRVNVEVLEDLMTMVSELVLTRNQLLQMVRKLDDSEFKVPLQRLSHVTTELQESVMKTRMQPIGNAWGKLPRIVRDLAVELGKKIELEMHGAETELDRQVLDMIKDPLTHMVRNSADHGLELPADRRRAGKPETGRVILDAFHEGGHIIIKVQDDGRGINVAKVKKKIVSTGLATESELAAMPEQQILQFIFRAGFSTAEKVTAVSGRGVGMDVVRTNVEKIGGQIELSSVEGKGSTFTIKIPLTLAIVSALIVECSGERFAIPQLSVVELVRVSKNSEHRVETINHTPVLRLRNRLLPLISLKQLLKLDTAEQGPGAKESAEPSGQEMFVIVAQVGAYRFGLVVDRVHDTEEIVVKPVAPILRNVGIYSGNTILGDGSVIMILDPNGIAAATGEITIADQGAASGSATSDGMAGDRIALLVFRAGTAEAKAVPLALIARLEEFDAATIETSNGGPVVQYRGKLMPLVPVDPSFTAKTTGRQPVIVFGDGDSTVGLLVDEIVDIVEDNLDIQLGSSRDGLLGSAIVSGKTTEIIDAAAYFTRIRSDWFTARKPDGQQGRGKKRLLFLDDSTFFRNLLSPILTAAGYAVTSVSNANDALEMRSRGETFDIIISDIEMPGMDGFEFARAVRAEGPWKDIPLIALSSRATPSDFARGREAGFVDYVAKLDRAALLESLAHSHELAKGAAA